MNVRMLRLHAKAVATLLAGCLVAMFSPATTTATAKATATAVAVPDSPTAEAGNPFVDGWYADPDVAVYDDTYWVYPTTSKTYAEQTYLDAFSSTDLVNWTKHEKVLTTEDVSWAEYAVWAPAPVERNGKYYLFFAANDIQNDSSLGGIGVAVADKPEGPYSDALGHPLIGQFHNGAQPIDQDVFIDDDGQAYMYYGGWGHANVVKLNDDMTSLGTFADGSTYKEITPADYVEGSQMFKRDGMYYLMWSEGGWTGPDYSVSYAMSDSPTGPFEKIENVLAQDPAVAKGSGHNSVLNVPGTDIWYIVYHRRPLSESAGNNRQLAYDRMHFNADGTIEPVTMRVRDNFADGNSVGWKTYGGSWSAGDGSYRAKRSQGGKALLDTNFADFTYDADVTVTAGNGNGTGNSNSSGSANRNGNHDASGGDAGLIFRAARPAVGVDSYAGYYAGIGPTGKVVLGRADDGVWTPLKSAQLPLPTRPDHHLRISAVGSTIKVYVDDMATPAISVTDDTYRSGANGVRVFDTAAAFDNVSVDKAG
ncbi:family 43 glycosylhydrolase [Streptomyces sp. NPDC059943]|uniref:family 43 glycosylhydrolase n=1 Tax=Streptomyces sp. NPDC059943 TaxID=3347010 RepID=UPI00365FF382